MKKGMKRSIISLLLLILIAGIGFGIFVSDYYHAGSRASAIAANPEKVTQENVWLALETENKNVGLIFYPGAKVEHTSYLPILEELQEKGINCYLVEMPFHLAFLGENRAQAVMNAHPEIKAWYLAGHSMGGAFASHFAGKHSEEIQGVILLGAYLYGDFPAERCLTIYGSEDLILSREKITYTENVHVLSGGNHGQFGDHGFQKGDGAAFLSRQAQWKQTIALIFEFIMG